MSNLIDLIQKSCDFLLSKRDKRNNPIGTITTQITWADWEKRWFSPMLAVLWETSVDGSGNLVFPDNWKTKVAAHLQVDSDWVGAFNYYATGLNQQTIFSMCVETGELSKHTISKELDLSKFEVSPAETAQEFKKRYPAITSVSLLAHSNFLPEIQRNLSLDIIRKCQSLYELQ